MIKKVTVIILSVVALLSCNNHRTEDAFSRFVVNELSFQGELGKAQELSISRFFDPPFTSVGWLRADLTNENTDMSRSFKNYNGDVSGRYLELMAFLSHGDKAFHPALKQFLEEIPSRQQKDGHFGYDEVDWTKPIDAAGALSGRLLPLLWGNARFLCGLTKAYKVFNEPVLLDCAKKLGDYYLLTADRFLDANRMSEYSSTGTYAAGYTTCYFPAMEGLLELYRITEDTKYLELVKRQAEFYIPFDTIPFDHSHGMLCNQYSLLRLYELTNTQSYLNRVEKRWNELVDGGYISALGIIGEKCKTTIDRDEGCAMTDWLRVNLELAKITGKAKYWDMADRILSNHYVTNQFENGGFGHRKMITDNTGTIGLGDYHQEATWCCEYHGTMGYELLKPFVLSKPNAETIQIHFALNFTLPTIVSATEWIQKPDEIMSQTITVKDASIKKLLVRIPDWATSLTDSNGKIFETENGYAVVPVSADNKAVIVYHGGIVVENRRCQPKTEEFGDLVLRYGPKLLVCPDETQKVHIHLPTELSHLTANELTVLTPDVPETEIKLQLLNASIRSKQMIYVFE